MWYWVRTSDFGIKLVKLEVFHQPKSINIVKKTPPLGKKFVVSGPCDCGDNNQHKERTLGWLQNRENVCTKQIDVSLFWVYDLPVQMLETEEAETANFDIAWWEKISHSILYIQVIRIYRFYVSMLMFIYLQLFNLDCTFKANAQTKTNLSLGPTL